MKIKEYQINGGFIMKKFVVILLSLIMSGFVFAGCTPDEPPTPAPEAALPQTANQAQEQPAPPAPLAPEPPPVAEPPVEQPEAEIAVQEAEAYMGLFDIVGMWQDECGTIRTFHPDGTTQNVQIVDIGGPRATWMLSANQVDGFYLLQTEQSGMNQATWYVMPLSADDMRIYQTIGSEPLYVLTRR